MKINLTLEVSDDLRRVIGKLAGAEVTQDGLATRLTVMAFIRERFTVATAVTDGFEFPEQLNETDVAGYDEAISYLKASGWDSTQIKRWIFKQRARRDFIASKLS